ncbi:hypothetical protein-transmembrane prediction [Rhodopirellula baltica SH 1]|uniref:Uncharacterized protein n=1 Tax=Rhodopirellula baltica (strain DSM 10527 / NCIMB 13988 / SH1) TaxID=243090 RepID=Q7UKV2_RHOBA|nr:hypothetical protein-transmembrane prediction [Rhodopirellula baltica SH 1]
MVVSSRNSNQSRSSIGGFSNRFVSAFGRLIVGTFCTSWSGEVFTTSVGENWLNQTRIQLDGQFTNNGLRQCEGTSQLSQIRAFHAEIDQVVGALLVLVDWISELLLHPHPTDLHFTTVLGDQLFELLGDATGIACVVIAIEDEQRFVSVDFCHGKDRGRCGNGKKID